MLRTIITTASKDIYSTGCHRKAKKIMKDLSHSLITRYHPEGEVPNCYGDLHGEICTDLRRKQLWGFGPSDYHHSRCGGWQRARLGHHPTVHHLWKLLLSHPCHFLSEGCVYDYERVAKQQTLHHCRGASKSERQ
uniref:uncharacterized protein LOC123993963 isoform X2 n=1 Tax=Oncorhynchus gorbuscha TaxID=8017 RepID=UPI001EAF44FD|nr:uncharacterized protein LOC123993963 isoform X2 [Oncorhynchus gorbuscha]